MLAKELRILNFDDSITKQGGLLEAYPHRILDLRESGPAVRCWMDKSGRSIIADRICGSEKSAVTFLGSGDFHHISEVLISQFIDPLSVFVFDAHPDWDILPPRFGCGSWVSEVLKKKNVLKLVLLGVSSGDISSLSIHFGNRGALSGDRLEIYPSEHPPTRVFFRGVPENASLEVERVFFSRRIRWSELSKTGLADFFQGLLQRLPVKQAYISLDKDCLQGGFALTNWEEGKLPLEELLLLLGLIRDNLEIVGFDITGDYSPALTAGAIRKFASRLDHPRRVRALDCPESEVSSINEGTNRRILELLFKQ